MKGIFTPNSPQDLLAKLRRDFSKLEADPANADLAFNFFVTANAMLDWLYPGGPGTSGQAQRRQEWNNSVLVQVCDHLASGAKHFRHLAGHHASVRDTARTDNMWGKGFWNPKFWARGFWAGDRLVVHLDGSAAQALGDPVSAVELAEKILDLWERHRDLQP